MLEVYESEPFDFVTCRALVPDYYPVWGTCTPQRNRLSLFHGLFVLLMFDFYIYIDGSKELPTAFHKAAPSSFNTMSANEFYRSETGTKPD
ncbi:hypothetical protein [Rhodohalobacter mucosus]|uniref:Uncharacterized protein n=1 Tax=Rhodohalobacter mucosus TaxID=2079485 RepID=A0A316TR03_9BACT|nr:hypothetical protein [Rhodohalobacter mucosus]PWN07037.1 hypothetical protein DDZ15_07140 [Rhodohalobacter mucosus]